VNQPAGMSVENYKFDDNKYDVFNLMRYDLGKQYVLDPVNTTHCRNFQVHGTMPETWAWLELASYVGTYKFENQSVDVWEAQIGYAHMRLAVSSQDPTTPIYIFRSSRGERNSTYEFSNWTPTAPSEKFFTVPSACNAPASEKPSVSCTISRSTILARAKVWVDHHVPYNQGADYEGYREDCSGYVSMCWESSKPGHTTSTMHEIAHKIDKAELQPGDCLLYAAEHVVLFGGWLNSAHTQYQAYEETRPGEGTVTRATPYPYWYSTSDFIPFRYNDVC
jgi:hypothetical protein